MKKSLLYVILIAALLLSACSAKATTAAPATKASDQATQPPAQNGEKITIKLWSHQNQSFNSANQEIINKFMAQNPNIEVKYETFPYDQFIQTLQTAMAAGTEADVIEMFGTWTCSYANGGRLAEVPLDIMGYGQAKEIFFQAPLDGYYCGGKLYGLPNEFNLEAGGALVNPELFSKHGLAYPPAWTTFAELRADAIKMTETENGVMTKAGFHYTNGDGLAFAFFAGILQQGADYFAADKKHFNFDSPEARNTVQLLVDMAQKDKIVDPVLFNNDSNPVTDSFFQGNVGIGFIGSWAAGEGRVNYPDMKFDYVAIPPYFGSEVKFAADSGWGKVVSKNSKNQAAAWKLVEFMTAEQENALLFNSTTGTIPAMKAIVASPDKLLAQAPWVKPTFDLLPHGQYIGDLTDRDQLFYEIIYRHLLDAIQGTITADEAVAKIQEEANAMVDAKK